MTAARVPSAPARPKLAHGINERSSRRLSLSEDIEAQGLDHHDMSGPRAPLYHLQAAVDGGSQEALLPAGSEQPFEDAEVLEVVAKRERFGSLQPKEPSLKDLRHGAACGTMSLQIFWSLIENTLKTLPSV